MFVVVGARVRRPCTFRPGFTLRTMAARRLLVVALEQALAAPICTSRLADAGARVIKIERAEGDFARHYDRMVVRPGLLLCPPRGSGH